MSLFQCRAACAVALTASLALPARAQAPAGDELALFQLDDVLSKETTVASRKAKTLRESPGIVTIVTRDEIRDSGARDLIDVLMSVPGFQLGGEVSDSTGVGFRGMWGAEGKVLVLVDGVILNDLLYGTAQIDSYPIDDVQQIEIVRGPGSAQYGGFAELAVVNVVTRSGAGAAASATYGQLDHGLGRRALSLAYGREGDGWSVRGYASGGQSVRGAGSYVDGSGVSFPMSQNALDDVTLNAGATLGKLALRVLHNGWRNDSRDYWGDTLAEPYRQRWTTTAGNARYELALGEAFRLLPEATFLRSTPWEVKSASDGYYYDKTVDRYTGRLALAWDPARTVSITVGGEAYAEETRLNQPSSDWSTLPDGKSTFSSQNLAAYAEAAWDAPFANLLAGGRFEHHSRFGDSFVPRVALTKLFEPFHLKLLYAHAFRAPAVENIVSNPGIRPERTRSFEAEIGWRATEATFLAVNAFYTRVEDAIVYNTDAVVGDQYENYAQTGAHGIELDVRHEAGWGTANLTYSFYTTADSNKVDVYAVPGHDDEMLAFAAHKVTARAAVRVGHDVRIAPALTFLSDRWGYTSYDAAGAPVLGHVGPKLTADLFVTWRNAFVRGLEVGAGVHDLLDTGSVFVTPYRPTGAVHGFLPGPGREVMLRVAYGD